MIKKNLLDVLHILIHADNAMIIAWDRASAIQKLLSILEYCKRNHILCQFSICEFFVVNGDSGDTVPHCFGNDSWEKDICPLHIKS